MNTRTPMVAGNWKMNGDRTLVEQMTNKLNQQAFDQVDVVVCPPAGYLTMFNAQSFALGGQDASHLENGAHTGDTSVAMLKELGARYVIIGHSERRQDHKETNVLVAQKVARVLAAGLTPIFCVGEALSVRQQGEQNKFVGSQLGALFGELSAAQVAQCVIAYEPIWAIGTGETASPEQAQDVHRFIRGYLAEHDAEMAQKVRILYGGSVKADNAEALFAQPDIDGGLIGGASLKVDDFIAICQAAI